MKKSTLLLLLLIAASPLFAQQRELKTPEASQEAMVMQRIGLTDITISYHSPLAKGRIIWGDLVPYNEVWRAGANENTVITFSSDVKIEGKSLPAGSYGLHMIPSQKEWTIIFNKNSAAWGSFFYDQKEDALRVTVTPQQAENQDWLSYTFNNLQPESATATLRWEKLAVPFKVSIDVAEVTYQSMKKELTNINGFFWQGFNQAAAYCIQKNIHLDQASEWVDKSIGMQKTFANLNTKSRLLTKQGKTAEADAIKKEALALADENQMNIYGYELLTQEKTKEAIDIFKANAKKYPDSWNVYDSLGEGLEKAGDMKGAISNYKTALSKAPENQKKRIGDILKKLENNKNG
jgi:tetratricopeptide (TPR) repeat protein